MGNLPLYSRRQLLKSVPAVGVGASALLAAPRPAKAAVDPMTVSSVASVAFSIYRMSRSGGGGIADLLSAQVEMLRSISAQVGVINSKLDLVYAKLGDIEETLDRMPQAVTSSVFRGQVLGSLLRGGGVLQSAHEHEVRRGRPYAISMLQEDAGRVLGELANPVASIMVERSAANLPILTMAWFTELQLRGRAMPYERDKIQRSARLYRSQVVTLLPQVERRMDAIRGEAAAVDVLVKQAGAYASYGCWDQIVDVAEPRGGGGAGGMYYKQAGRWNEVVPGQPAAIPEAGEAAQSLADLAAAGVDIPNALMFELPTYGVTRDQRVLHERYHSGALGGVTAAAMAGRRQLYGWSCEARLGSADGFVANQEALRTRLARLRRDAIVNGHLLLVGQELYRSADTVLARLPAT